MTESNVGGGGGREEDLLWWGSQDSLSRPQASLEESSDSKDGYEILWDVEPPCQVETQKAAWLKGGNLGSEGEGGYQSRHSKAPDNITDAAAFIPSAAGWCLRDNMYF